MKSILMTLVLIGAVAFAQNRTKDQTEMMDFAKEHMPKRYKRMQNDNQLRRRLLPEMRKRFQQLKRLQKSNADDYQLALSVVKTENEIDGLIENYQSAQTDTEKKQLESEIRKKLETVFQTRETLYKNEINRLEDALKQATDRLKLRTQNKEELIEKRLNSLLRNLDDDQLW
ncbi:MAG: hypothetical protein KDD94_11715 [Calditrichaeota bacterium]|nr:hypothetical protein [Calditrichota bacterium]